MGVFDDALNKRFEEAPLITSIEVTSNDTLLIRDLETGVIMRMPVSILTSAFSGSFATLIDGKVPASQLPSYVDDVLEYANLAAFPGTGESGKIYVAQDTNKTYRWSGSAYVEISASLALGETSSSAYRGDRGKTAYDHSQTSGNPHGTTKSDVGLSNVDNTSDVNKPVSTAQQTALDFKANKALDAITYIQSGDFLNSWTNYTGSFPDAGYFKDQFGIVHLTGLIKLGTIGTEAFMLPVGYRPSKYIYLPAGGASASVVRIAPDGGVRIHSGSNAYVSLDNVQFRIL